MVAMPFLENERLRALVGDRADGEYTLDLRGVTAEGARFALESMLERRRFGAPTSVVVRIDRPTPTSGATLFQPIARQLLDARKRGLVLRFGLLPEGDGGGFHVELPGHPGRTEADG